MKLKDRPALFSSSFYIQWITLSQKLLLQGYVSISVGKSITTKYKGFIWTMHT